MTYYLKFSDDHYIAVEDCDEDFPYEVAHDYCDERKALGETVELVNCIEVEDCV